MDILLDQSNVNHQELKSYLTKITVTELTKLSEPCYFPALNKYSYEILKLTGLEEVEIRKRFKLFFKEITGADTSEQSRDLINCELIFIMHYFLKKRDSYSFRITMLYYMLRRYTNMCSKMFKFCKPELFKYALDNVSKTHLFSREKTISSAIYFLSSEMIKKYQGDILDANPQRIFLFLGEARTRVAQSIKSFAEVYYDAGKHGLAYKNPYENEETPGETYQMSDMSRAQKVGTEVSKIICIYKRVDRNAIEDAKKITRIKSELAELLVKEMSDVKYIDNVRLIIELFIKDLKETNQLCGNTFLPFVKSFMSLKRTTKVIYFKQQVYELTDKLIDEIGYRKKYDYVTNQTKFLINCFTAYYICLVTRHIVCGTTKMYIGSFSLI